MAANEIVPAAGTVCTVKAAAELLRIALVRGAPRTATVAALGIMLEDFAASCERVARFVGTRDAAGAHDLACFCCARIARTQPGDVLLLPLGWLGATTEITPSQATIVLVVLCRRRDRPGTFDLAIVNGGGKGGADGDGAAMARYHGIKADMATADLWSRAAVVVADVPQEKLQDGGIWFILYRFLVFPHAPHQSLNQGHTACLCPPKGGGYILHRVYGWTLISNMVCPYRRCTTRESFTRGSCQH